MDSVPGSLLDVVALLRYDTLLPADVLETSLSDPFSPASSCGC